jgi:hypothetical protein
MEHEAAYLAKLHAETQVGLFRLMRFSPYGFKLLVLVFSEAIAVV